VTSWRSSSSGVPSHFFSSISLNSPPLSRIGRIEGAWEKFDAFRKTLDYRKAIVVHRALNHLNHMIDLRGVCACNEGRPGRQQFLDRINGLVDCPRWIRFGFIPDRRGGRRLLFGQAVDKIIHDDIGYPDVFAGAVIEMIAANRKPVPIAAEKKDVKIRSSQTDPGSQRDGAPVNEVGAMRG